MIVNDNSGGISYDLELSISIVIMFIAQAANYGVTYEHHLDHNHVHSTGHKLWRRFVLSFTITNMFVV
jgi:hypothetical protein